MRRFRLSAEASSDLQEIWEYIAQDSPQAAERLLDEFDGAFATLRKLPRIGHSRPDLTSKPLLFWGVRSYLIAYDPESNPLQIAAVLHGNRDLRRVLKGRSVLKRVK